MAGQFAIRLATLEDAEIIADHRARMFAEMGDVPSEAFTELRERSHGRLRELLRSGEYVGWLASPLHDPSTIAGGAGVQLRRVLPHPLSLENQWIGIAEGRHAIVINVFTEPEWRRRGIAGLLMQEIIDWKRTARLDSLVLHASEAGRTLYERLGFITTNEMRLVDNEIKLRRQSD